MLRRGKLLFAIMIDYALEKYPVSYFLETGIQCQIRPLESKDESAFIEFLHQVPEFERLFIKQRLDNPLLLQDWCSDLDYEARLPLLAFSDDQVIGLATLEQRHGGWKRHIGMTHLLTHPEFRGVGLSGLLIREIIDVARHCGLCHLQAEFNAERQLAIRSFTESGFAELMRLPDYVKDMEAKSHAYVLMGMDLTTDIENTGGGD